MSAVADFTMAVLDCPTCTRHFIETHMVVAMHRERVACPHCGAHYVDQAHSHDPLSAYADAAARGARSRARNRLHMLSQRRRKLH